MAQLPSGAARLPEATPAEGAVSPHPHRAWNDAPLRVKITLLVALAAVGGSLVGIIEAHTHHAIWPLSVGLTLVVLLVFALGRAWIWSPFERLLMQLSPYGTTERPTDLNQLPLDRQDEVGQLARAMFQLTSRAIRDHHEAKQLRRTLDHRVAEATRQATLQLRHMAMRDSLTDLGNRRFLEEHLEPLVQSVQAAGSDLVCLLIDMDHFKKVNDTLGHAAGDELLICLAHLLRASIRREDYAVRLGGDEFVVFMPDCTPARAQQTYDQVRTLFRQQAHTALPETIEVDLSGGIASLVRDGARSGRQLMESADANLYAAKRAGKGRAMGA